MPISPDDAYKSAKGKITVNLEAIYDEVDDYLAAHYLGSPLYLDYPSGLNSLALPIFIEAYRKVGWHVEPKSGGKNESSLVFSRINVSRNRSDDPFDEL